MERDLINRLRVGDKEAFDKIYEMYSRRLLAYSLKHISAASDAEDMVQETFIALWKNRDRLKNTDSLKPFLFTSLRNRILNFHKSRINSPIYSDYIEMVAENVAADYHRSIEYTEFEKEVLDFIGSLTQTQQRVIRLSKFHNLSNQEIADKLNLSIQTVKNALSTGLKQLNEKIKSMGKNDFILFFAVTQVFLMVMFVIDIG